MSELTETQLEKAAREYCRLAGLDPEAEAIDHACEALCWTARWRTIVPKIQDHHRIMVAIAIAEEE